MLHSRQIVGLLAAIQLAACSTDSTSPTIPEPSPAPVIGQWSARTAAGSALPYVAERVQDWPTPRGVHEIRLDRGDLVLTADGRYQYAVYSSEWQSEDPGSGQEFIMQYRFADRDFGTWTRNDSEIVLTSHWIQNRVTRGIVRPDGVLELQHGLLWGDPLLAVRYLRGI
jgi:hypothetical protein